MFVTIQDGINAAAPGDVVVVGPGNYSETLSILTNIKLVGANEGIDPSTDVRGSETCLIPNAVGIGPLVLIGSSDVTIDGFCINGSNPTLGHLGVINGVNLTVAFGVQNFGGENNFVFTNNIVSTFDTAMQLFGPGSGGSISHNLFDNIDQAAVNGFAINLVSNYYSSILNNVFTRTMTGIFATSYNAAGSALIDRNDMSVTGNGIVLDRLGGSTGVWTVSNNVIVGAGSASSGITVEGVQDTASVILNGNAIDTVQFGIMLIDNPTSVDVSMTNELLINCAYGIYAQEGSFAFVDGDSNYLVDAAFILNPSAYAIYVNDIDSISASVTRVTVQNGTIVLGGLNGAGVEGSGAVLAFSGAEPINFIGTVANYIELINSPRDIDARQVLFEGLTGANMTVSQIAAVEAKIVDKVDNPALGVVMIVSAQISVTKLNDLTGNGQTGDDTPIQGWTVYLWTNGIQGAPQLTGADGIHSWTNLGPGVYNVSEDVPAGWTATSVTNHGFGSALSGGVYSFTFTNFQNVNITVTKLMDLTGNGQTRDDIADPRLDRLPLDQRGSGRGPIDRRWWNVHLEQPRTGKLSGERGCACSAGSRPARP